MSNGNMNIRIELENFDEFAKAVRAMPKRFESILMSELRKVALQAERYARQLAPYDTGDLEASINAGPVKREGSAYVVYVGTNKEYATYVHELNSTRIGDKYDKGIKITGYYVNGRGKRTRDKPSVKGYQPGRKYLRNAIVLTDTHLTTAMNRAIDRLFGGI